MVNGRLEIRRSMMDIYDMSSALARRSPSQPDGRGVNLTSCNLEYCGGESLPGLV